MRCTSIIMYAVGQAFKEGRVGDAQPAFQAATHPKPEGNADDKPASLQQGQVQQVLRDETDPRLICR